MLINILISTVNLHHLQYSIMNLENIIRRTRAREITIHIYICICDSGNIIYFDEILFRVINVGKF